MKKNKKIIIRKYKKIHSPYVQGGNWKIAYADFVTAMMAFFLLMWLVHVSSEESKRGLAEYFSTSLVDISTSNSGNRGLMNERAFIPDNDSSSQQQNYIEDTLKKENELHPKNQKEVLNNESQSKKDEQENVDQNQKGRLSKADKEKKILIDAQKYIIQNIEKSPQFTDLESNLRIDFINTGMRIQIIDNKKRSMFAVGGSELLPHTQKLLKILAQSIANLSQKIVISGHTDALPYKNEHNYSNWDLSIDRAQITRKFLEISGVKRDRFAEVVGKESTEPLIEEDPKAPENRRISITLLYTDHLASTSF